MKATHYGNTSNIEYEDRVDHQDGDRYIKQQRYQKFPNVAPNIHSADTDSDGTSGRSSLIRLHKSLPLNENGSALQSTSPVPDWRRKSGETKSRMRNPRWNGEVHRYPNNSNYQGGPSSYLHRSGYSQSGEPQSHNGEYDVPKRSEYLERDRAELLKKLSDLENQLVRSCRVDEQGKQRHLLERSKHHHESYGNSCDWLQDNSSISSSASVMADKHVTFPHYPQKHPYTEAERHNVARGSYLFSSSSNDMERHEKYFDPQIPRRGATLTLGPYQESSSNPTHFSVQSADASDPHRSGSRHCSNPLRQPDCSCFHCYNKLKSPLAVQSRRSMNTGYTDISNSPKFQHQNVAQSSGQLGYDSQNSNSSMGMGDRITHVRWPSERESSIDELVHGQSRVTAKVKRIFRPIAGGAPFLTCRDCFEVLQLPQEIIKTHNQQQKIQCGACSSFIYFVAKRQKFVASFQKETMEKSKEREYGSNMEEAKQNLKGSEHVSNEAVKELVQTHGRTQTRKGFQSDDFHCSVYDKAKGYLGLVEHRSNIAVEETAEDQKELEHIIEGVEELISTRCPKNEANRSLRCSELIFSGDESHLMDKAPDLSVPSSGSNSNKSLDAQSLLDAVNSEDDDPEECTSAEGELADASDDSNVSPSTAVSARGEQHDYSTTNRAVYWFGTHSQIKRAKSEGTMPEKSTPNVNLVTQISAETETEVSYYETPNTNISTDTTSDSKNNEDPPGINNGGFFAGNIKDRVRDLVRSVQVAEKAKFDVTINGHPIPDHLVKEAENLAGPILPGNYWYDFRAGFWGVTGGPCLGIIPPKIQEFDYPVSKNCSNGTTGVIVNGRELHEKDLALLHSRGLPIESGKSYIIEISGRVVGKDSGEKLDSLGELAPTIARLKRGFGMRVPGIVHV